MKPKSRPTDIVRMDVHVSRRMKAVAGTLATDQGCTSVSEWIRLLIRRDAEARGFDIPETYPRKVTV